MTMPWKSSIEFSSFQKLSFLVEISKVSKTFEKMKNSSRKALLLYELFAREAVNGSPRVANGLSLGKARRVILVQ